METGNAKHLHFKCFLQPNSLDPSRPKESYILLHIKPATYDNIFVVYWQTLWQHCHSALEVLMSWETQVKSVSVWSWMESVRTVLFKIDGWSILNRPCWWHVVVFAIFAIKSSKSSTHTPSDPSSASMQHRSLKITYGLFNLFFKFGASSCHNTVGGKCQSKDLQPIKKKFKL